MSERITDRIATIITDYFDKLENQRLQNQMANQKAERNNADKAVARQVKMDGKQLERDIMQNVVDVIKAITDEAKTVAAKKTTAPLSEEVLRQLEALKLRSALSEADVEALFATYGTSYQFCATLRDLLDAMGTKFTVAVPGLQEYHDALDKLQQSASATVWNASGTAEKDKANFAGNLFLWRALGESAWSQADAYEELFAQYEG
jgi:hypothetical protein